MQTRKTTRKTQTPSSKLRGAAATTVIVALIACGVWLTGRVSRNSDDLMARATLAVPATVWKSDGVESGRYGWISDHEIVHLEQTGAVCTPVVLDAARPDTSVRRIIAAPLLPIRGVSPVSFSPDGKWLLLEDRTAYPRHYFALALDGSKKRLDWPDASYGGSSLLWRADSRRFILVLFDSSKNAYIAHVFSVDKPGASKAFRLPGIGRKGSVPVGALPSGRFLGRDSASGWGASGASVPANETLTEFDIGPGAGKPRAVAVSAPVVAASTGIRRGASGGVVLRSRSLRISPGGDRLLWIVSTFDFAPPPGIGTALGRRLYPVLMRVLPFALQPSHNIHYRYELATARVDGRGGVTRLGNINPPVRRTKHGGVTYGFISDWAWTPDGKRISFTYDGALYTVSATAP